MRANSNSKRPATRRGNSQAGKLTARTLDREHLFESVCRRKGLDPVAVCEGEGPGVAINRTGRRVYVQVDARFVRVPLYASVWWFERIFRSSGWTTFDDGALRWLRMICKRLETV